MSDSQNNFGKRKDKQVKKTVCKLNVDSIFIVVFVVFVQFFIMFFFLLQMDSSSIRIDLEEDDVESVSLEASEKVTGAKRQRKDRSIV